MFGCKYNVNPTIFSVQKHSFINYTTDSLIVLHKLYSFFKWKWVFVSVRIAWKSHFEKQSRICQYVSLLTTIARKIMSNLVENLAYRRATKPAGYQNNPDDDSLTVENVRILSK
jgi:hypothetical protein